MFENCTCMSCGGKLRAIDNGYLCNSCGRIYIVPRIDIDNNCQNTYCPFQLNGCNAFACPRYMSEKPDPLIYSDHTIGGPSIANFENTSGGINHGAIPDCS